jgi:ABC-2 type transport system ATP-binding protein
VDVLGTDPQRAGPPWRERIGVMLQSSSLYPNLTARESLVVFAGYYAKPRDPDEVIEIVGLTEKQHARVRTLSGGQQRRLDLGLALVGDPELVFLDEPTTGFDPGARRTAWDTIRNLRALGKTILLTTHYLDEAEQLADRVAVLRDGEIVREGSPADLTGGSVETEIRYRRAGEELVERTSTPTQRLNELTAEALARGEELEALEVRRPTLEDVYLELTAE